MRLSKLRIAVLAVAIFGLPVRGAELPSVLPAPNLSLQHGNEVCFVAFSPDGKTLASASGKTVRLWETVTGKEIRALDGHQAEVTALALSPDGKRLASASHDETVRLWETATGKELCALWQHQGRVTSVVFSPDGKRLASGCTDGLVRLWEAASGQEILRLKRQAEVTSVAFSPDGRSLAAACSDGSVGLWETATGKKIHALHGHRGPVTSLAFSPDGKNVASASSDESIRLWETADGKESHAIQYRGKWTKWVTSVAFSPDGRSLAAASSDGSIRLWETVTCQEIRVLQSADRIWAHCIAFSPDGKRLAAASGNTARVLSVGRPSALPRKPLTAEQLPALWAALAGDDAPKAHQALWALVDDPQRAIPFLQEHLKPAAAASPQRVAALLADLDGGQFVARRRASEELEKLGASVAAAIQARLADGPSLELQQRLEALLLKLDSPTMSPEQLRAVRAVQLLECIGTANARQLLDKLAQGAPGFRLSEEAKRALQRLDR
jgi:WD domain, G-beta repeat/WD40-like Beta Propeller Repeat